MLIAKKYFLVFLLTISYSSFSEVVSSQDRGLSDYLSLSQQLELSQHSYWRLLLRLYSDNQSEVRDAKFFLSIDNAEEDFSIDPQVELDTFLTALFTSTANEAHPLCVFPLRSRWLIEQLSIPSDVFSAVKCVNLQSFLQSYRHDRASLLFMDERVNTIPNMMGHIGLRLYSKDGEQADEVVTYITVLHTLNPLSMLYNALISGGEGVLSLHDFNEVLDYYLQDEGRSIWQYDLAINSKQIETVLLQLWEVRNRKSRYTYLSYNCVTPLFDLMRTADSELESKFLQQKSIKYWYSPLEYMQFLRAAGYIKNPHNPKIYLSQEAKDKNPSVRQLRGILDKQKTSRFSFGLGTANKNADTQKEAAINISFDLQGSLLSDNHRRDFSEYELRIMSFDGNFQPSNNAFQMQQFTLYSVQYLPSFKWDLASLSWQLKVGAKRFFEIEQFNFEEDVVTDFFAPQVKSAVGVANRVSKHAFLWALVNAQYVYRQTANSEFVSGSELGMMIDFHLFENEFKSTLYYWDYFNDVGWILPRFKWVLNWRLNQDYEANFSALLAAKRQDGFKMDNVLSAFSLSYYF